MRAQFLLDSLESFFKQKVQVSSLQENQVQGFTIGIDLAGSVWESLDFWAPRAPQTARKPSHIMPRDTVTLPKRFRNCSGGSGRVAAR